MFRTRPTAAGGRSPAEAARARLLTGIAGLAAGARQTRRGSFLIMVVGTLYPPVMADAAGHADHRLAMALFWAMSAGFVRGVGFVPRLWVWRAIFSGWACAVALLLAAVLKLQH
jgi:predicted membrane protein